MGQLLILLKKRTKKFKVIVASFSENEQAAIFDLLSKQGMEEYAVDFAPKYHKL
jgi:ABC-type phosphate/phosphonate transport system ATPase subunit